MVMKRARLVAMRAGKRTLRRVAKRHIHTPSLPIHLDLFDTPRGFEFEQQFK
jgi:hypothetical protein